MSKEVIFKKELSALLASISDTKEMDTFLKAILTPAEHKEIATRLQIFKQLKAGVSQRAIAEDLGIGIATVTRGSRVLLEHPNGFKTMFS